MTAEVSIHDFEPTSTIFFWIEEYCQTSPNKNRSPNLWHVISILVCCIFDLNYSTFFLWNIFDYILTPCTNLSYCQVQHQAQNWQPKHWRCLWCSPLEKPQKSFQGSILAPSQFRLAYDQHSFQFGSGLQAQFIYWDSKRFATIAESFYYVNYGSLIILSNNLSN